MKFSIIVPVAPNRNAEIIECIKRQNYPKNKFEIIVEKGLNPSENRNKGIEKATGDLVVFLDDDAYIMEDYLAKLDNFLKEFPEVDIVGGPQLTPKGEGFFAKTSGIVFSSVFGTFNVRKRYSKSRLSFNAKEDILTSANLCSKRKIFKKIAGFDTRLFPGEDPEFIYRAKKNGLKIAYSPEMIIYHKRRPNFTGFFKQNFMYGVTRPRKNRIAGNTPLFFLTPMIFTIYILFLPLMILLHKFLIIPLAIYILLALIFAIYDSIKEKYIKGICLVPFLYLMIHISYGLGTIAGYMNIYIGVERNDKKWDIKK
jgi:GT2 family glycosyltransferase